MRVELAQVYATKNDYVNAAKTLEKINLENAQRTV